MSPLKFESKYRGYISRQNEFIAQTKKLEKLKLSADMDYSKIYGLSVEEVEKLNQVKPLNIAQAQRISGVNPSAIQAILIHVKKGSFGKQE